jgi:RNA polymerase sigma factor (sigma-70 family)
MLTFLKFKPLMTKPHSEILNDQQLLQALQTAGSQALEQLYVSYREEFIAFARKYKADEEDILDVYQDAIIAFFENIQSGKFSILSSTIKTYLFSIGKYKLIDKLKQNGKKTRTELLENIEEPIQNNFEEQLTLTDLQKQLKDAINELGEQCKKLLILFYYRQYSIDSIKNEMAYKNENVVKAHKSRCMKSLRTIISKKDIL